MIPMAGSDSFNLFPKIIIDKKLPINPVTILNVMNVAKAFASQPNLYLPNKYITAPSPTTSIIFINSLNFFSDIQRNTHHRCHDKAMRCK